MGDEFDRLMDDAMAPDDDGPERPTNLEEKSMDHEQRAWLDIVFIAVEEMFKRRERNFGDADDLMDALIRRLANELST